MTKRVLLLHGLWMPALAMRRLASRLRAAGFAPTTFAYASVTGGPEHAIPRLCARIGTEPAHIVGHSLGGVIALQALCEMPTLPVARVVCLGSPLRGSGAAVHLPLARWLLGRSAALLCQGLPCWQGRAEVGVIAGRLPLGVGALLGHLQGPHDGTVAVEETRIEGLADHVVVPASHSGLLFSGEAAAQTVAFLRAGRFRH
jgi:pimeloyl-ACP methyl ester carboxylesterase